jgi:hypothetical protein
VSDLNTRLKEFLTSLTDDPVEARVTDYVIRELHNGRGLFEIMKDPYVRNRLNDQKVEALLEKPEVVDAFESEIKQSFTLPDVNFGS